ncbi:MAG: hypothetical protein KKH75_03895, partial [Actinobacteria bacterium]|nr:hypothetical protein [Actinomycetota bacterium]
NGLVTAGVIVETDVDVMLPFIGTTFTDLAAVTGVEPAPVAIRAVGDYGRRAAAWSAFRTAEWTTLAGAAESACTDAGVIPAP